MEPVCSTILEQDPNILGVIFSITAAAGAIYFHWRLALRQTAAIYWPPKLVLGVL